MHGCQFIRVPELDKKTRHRLKSSLAGYADGAAAIVLLAGYALAGTIGFQLPLHLFIAQLLCEVIFVAAIASGISQRFGDPSLTAIQVGAGCGANVIVLFSAPQLLHMVILNMFVTLSFGSLLFSRRGFFITGILLTASVGTTLWLVRDGIRIPAGTNGELAMLFISLGAGMARFMQVSARVSGLRASLKEKNRTLEQLASHDSLTSLWNRRRFMEFLEEEQQRCWRTGDRFAVAIIDIDHFKAVNDVFGHLAGDHVLKETAKLLERAHRTTDTVGRYGGEEFTVLLVNPHEATVSAVLERMRTAVEQRNWDDVAAGLRVTISVGAAMWRPGESISQVLNRADAALYEAKNSGRNRVCCSMPDKEQPPVAAQGR